MKKKIKKNRCYVTIDTKALSQNAKAVKKYAKDMKVCAVIKDDAYNHGAILTDRYIRKYVDYYAVATIEEALELRHVNKKVGILIFTHLTKDDYADAIKNRITIACSYYKQISDIDKVAKKLHKKAVIHIAINTGMNRIGFSMSDDTIKEIKKTSTLKNIYMEGIFTHYATADDYDKNIMHKNLCDTQKNRFDEIKAKLSLEGIHFDISHIANSGGTVFGRFKGTNMIRPGNLFFGLPVLSKAQDKIKIKPVLGFYTSVSFVKYIEKGEYISYSMSYQTTRRTKVATIQVGFGDGYKRALSNKQDVYINGHRCRVIGRVSMDQTMVDVTGIDCKIGDKVELIGSHIPIAEVAQNAGTCYTDVTINITKRVERVIL